MLSIDKEMKRGDGASARKENIVKEEKMAPPHGSLGNPWGQCECDWSSGKRKRLQ